MDTVSLSMPLMLESLCFHPPVGYNSSHYNLTHLTTGGIEKIPHRWARDSIIVGIWFSTAPVPVVIGAVVHTGLNISRYQQLRTVLSVLVLLAQWAMWTVLNEIPNLEWRVILNRIYPALPGLVSMPGIPALQRIRQNYHCEFEASLGLSSSESRDNLGYWVRDKKKRKQQLYIM